MYTVQLASIIHTDDAVYELLRPNYLSKPTPMDPICEHYPLSFPDIVLLDTKGCLANSPLL